jgi:hypothetical protein
MSTPSIVSGLKLAQASSSLPHARVKHHVPSVIVDTGQPGSTLAPGGQPLTQMVSLISLWVFLAL